MKNTILITFLFLSIGVSAQKTKKYTDKEFGFSIERNESFSYKIDNKTKETATYSFFDEELMLIVKNLNSNIYDERTFVNYTLDENDTFKFVNTLEKDNELIVKVLKGDDLKYVYKIINSLKHTYILIYSFPLDYETSLEYFNTFKITK